MEEEDLSNSLQKCWVKLASDVAQEVGSALRQRVAASPSLQARVEFCEDDKRSKCYHVFQSFEGQEFQDLVCKRKRILGLPCLRHCLEMRWNFPVADKSPVYCLEMKELRICSTGLKREKKGELSRFVYYMGGVFVNDLTSDVTHLVCTRRSDSQKYVVAAKRLPNVAVVLPKWIEESWARKKRQEEGAFRVPVFGDLCVAFCGLSGQDVQRYTALVKENGGSVSDSLDAHCTHLVMGQLDEALYARATVRNQPVVSVDWITASLERGACFDAAQYQLALSSSGKLRADAESQSSSIVKFVASLVGFKSSKEREAVANMTKQLSGRAVYDKATSKACAAAAVTHVVLRSPTHERDATSTASLHDLGLPVVSYRWLRDSCKAKQVLPLQTYLLQRPKERRRHSSGRKEGRSRSDEVKQAAAKEQQEEVHELFRGYVFCFSGFSEEEHQELRDLVNSESGECSTQVYNVSATHYISQHGTAEADDDDMHLSEQWVRLCVQEQRLLPTRSAICRPLPHSVPYAEMRSLVISTTGFPHEERLLLRELIETLGATYSSKVSKKQTTHLICCAAAGHKYSTVRSKKWRVALVSADWLEQCAVEGRVVECAPFPPPPSPPNGSIASSASLSGHVRVLPGVTVMLSRTLGDQRKEIAIKAAALGADVVDAWDSSVTHFVVRGRPRLRDMPGGWKSSPVLKVSPEWVYQCERERRRLPESSFPPTLNPRLSLGVRVETERCTPSPVPSHVGPASTAATTPLTSGVLRTPTIAESMEELKRKAQSDAEARLSYDAPAIDDVRACSGAAWANTTTPIAKESRTRDRSGGSSAVYDGTTAAGSRSPLAGAVGAAQDDGEVKNALAGLLDALEKKPVLSEGPAQQQHHKSSRESTVKRDGGSGVKRLRGSGKRIKRSALKRLESVSSGGGAATLVGVATAASLGEGGEVSAASVGGLVAAQVDAAGALEEVGDKMSRDASGGMLSSHGADAEFDTGGASQSQVTYGVVRRRGEKQRAAAARRKRRKKEETERADSEISADNETSSSEVEDDDSSAEFVQTRRRRRSRKVPCFVFSKFSETERAELQSMVLSMKGRCGDEFVAGETTHVVVAYPTRSVKYLAGVAAGLWVLKKEFLIDSLAAKRWQSEADYEWAVKDLKQRNGDRSNEQKMQLATAPRKWRSKKASERKVMRGMRCVLVGPRQARETYGLLVEILGGACVYSGDAPDWNSLLESYSSVSLYVLQLPKARPKAVDRALLREEGVAMVSGEWIVHCLLQGHLLSVSEWEQSLQARAQLSKKERREAGGARAQEANKRKRN